jgi:hypothetical protein
MKRVALIVTVLFSVISLGAIVAAQNRTAIEDQGLNIEISPARLLLEGSPGKKIDATLKIRNRNLGTEELKFEIFKVVIKDSTLELMAPEPDDEFVTWVKFGKEQPFLAPYDQFESMPISIDIPKSAAFAYDYVILISKAKSPEVKPGETQAIEGKVAQFILLDVLAPGAVRSAEIIDIETSKKLYSFLPVDITTTVKNTGNLHVTPVGNIFIKDMSGRQVATLDVNKERGTILTNFSRKFFNQWAQGFPRYEDVEGERKLVWNWQDFGDFRFGKFKAEAVLVYNNGVRDIPMTDSTTFWVIPWILLLILLIILILVIYSIYRFIRGIARSIKKKTKKIKR